MNGVILNLLALDDKITDAAQRLQDAAATKNRLAEGDIRQIIERYVDTRQAVIAGLTSKQKFDYETAVEARGK
jgi:hypothetical protein